MSTLHIINTPQNPQALETLLSRTQPEDAILFTQDGCYTLRQPDLANRIGTDRKVYALDNDIAARNLDTTAQRIDYDDFVALTLAFNNSITW